MKTGGEPIELKCSFPKQAETPGFGYGVGSIKFSPDGKWLAAGFGGPSWRPSDPRLTYYTLVWNTESYEQIQAIRHEAAVTSIAFSPNNHALATADKEGNLVVHTDNKQKGGWAEEECRISKTAMSVAFAPDGSKLAGGFRGQIRFIDTTNWKPIPALDIAGPRVIINHLSYSTSGREILRGGSDTVIRMSSVESRQVVFHLRIDGVTTDFAVSQSETSDLNPIVVASGEKGVHMWRTSRSGWSNPRQAARDLQEQFVEAIKRRDLEHQLAIAQAASLHLETLDKLIDLLQPKHPQHAVALKCVQSESLHAIGKTKEADVIWAHFESAVDLRKPNEFLAHVYADALQRRFNDQLPWQTLSELEVESDGVRRPVAGQRGVLIGGGKEEYTLFARCPVSQIKRLRLEVLPELGVPNQLEDFEIVELSVFIEDDNGKERRLPFVSEDGRSEASRWFRPQLCQLMNEERPMNFDMASSGNVFDIVSCQDSAEMKSRRIRIHVKVGGGMAVRRLRMTVSEKPISHMLISLLKSDPLKNKSLPLAGFFRLALCSYLSGNVNLAKTAMELTEKTNTASEDDSPAWYANSKTVMTALIQLSRNNVPDAKTRAKKLLTQALQVKPREDLHAFECKLLRLASAQVIGLSELDAGQAAMKFARDCKRAYVASEKKKEDNKDHESAARSFIARELWTEAALELELVEPKDPLHQSGSWARAATLHAFAAWIDEERRVDYLRVCGKAESIFKPDFYEYTALRCLSLLGQQPNVKHWRKLVEKSAPTKFAGHAFARDMALALAAYRDNDFTETVERAESVIKEPAKSGNPYLSMANSLKSLAFAKENNQPAANEHLKKAKEYIGIHLAYHEDGRVKGSSVTLKSCHNTLAAQILFLEAERELSKLKE